MTVINGIEFDDIKYLPNDIKSSIKNNDKIEDKLHVVMVISNPCQYKKRFMLATDFIQRMEQESDVILYIVELAYTKQNFHVTSSNNPRHLQLYSEIAPLWHKENMINLGVQKLLPDNWKAFAWIDADLEFESATWASDTLKILNGSRDVVQLFSHANDMDQNENTMTLFASFGYHYTNGKKYGKPSFWHPGYAWAMTRSLYEKLGGLYEYSILGSGDHNMSFAMIERGIASLNIECTDEYKQSVVDFQNKIKGCKLGYVPGIIKHYFHGTKQNRKYFERWQILVKHKYSPTLHITKNIDGLLIPTELCPLDLLNDIVLYNKERNEDDFL